jgi:hypothetical protein
MEVEELVRGDAEWWPGFCAALAEDGQGALQAETRQRGWSWGALWKFIVDSPEVRRDYQSALEAYSQDKALETVGIADGASAEEVAVAKLRVETRFKLAGKVDRGRWGDQVTVQHSVDDFGEMLRRVSERGLARIKESQAPMLERVVSVVEVTQEDEI